MAALLNLGNGEVGGVTAKWSHSGDCLRPCRGVQGGQSLHPHGKPSRQIDPTNSEGSDLPRSLECLVRASNTHPRRSRSRDDCRQLWSSATTSHPGRLAWVESACQGAPHPRGCLVTDLGYATLQHRSPGNSTSRSPTGAGAS